MAKQQIIRRSTIGNDPFASIIPTNEAVTEVEADGQLPSPQLAEAPANPAIPKPFKRQKLTVHLRQDLAERVKNAAYWNPRLTIASIAEMGIYDAIERIEKEHGGPYPTRHEELRGGRPMK